MIEPALSLRPFTTSDATVAIGRGRADVVVHLRRVHAAQAIVRDNFRRLLLGGTCPRAPRVGQVGFVDAVPERIGRKQVARAAVRQQRKRRENGGRWRS
jgi:hypothetical protein